MKASSAVRRAGFTLIELLTVVALFGIVSIYVGRILVVNERAYHTVGHTSESQQNLRVFGELVEDDVRHAGMMVFRDTAVCGVDNTTAPDLLYVSDAAAIAPQDEEFTPFSGPTVSGGPWNLNTNGTAQTFTLSSLVVEPSPPSRPAYDTDGNGTADSDFRVNGGVIVHDPTTPTRGNACGRITAVNLGTSQITVVGVAAMASSASGLVAVPANEFRIESGQLRWNNVALADGIEDFQVAYVFDVDEDNVIDGNTDKRGFGEAGQSNYTSSELEPNQMREIQIGIVSRTRLADAKFTGRPQALLNRTPIATNDGFRRRTFESRIVLRNLATRTD